MLVLRTLLGHRIDVELPLTDEGERIAARGELTRLLCFGAVMLSAIALPVSILWDAHGDKSLAPIVVALVSLGLSLVATSIQSLSSGEKRVGVRAMDKVQVTLSVPSDAAATAFQERLHGWKPELEAAWSTRRAPEPRDCPNHPGTLAGWICGRCGSFACDACLERIRPDAMPLCRSCLARRPAGVASR
ncbi:MAG: hypothetical protein JST54_29265 [Deltaproteobacteria bacterium]|nr:hypothetical protein [Deltaproteobacteria bacterium]